MSEYRLSLPLPPSANVYWRWTKTGVYVSAKAKHYKEMIYWLAKEAQIGEPLTGAVAVTITVYRPQRRGDLDNRLKVLIDALRGIAYEDDSQIVELHAYQKEAPNNGSVEVEVKQVNYG